MRFTIWIKDNDVEVEFEHCSDLGPVKLSGGRLTKKLRK
jgi:hypothetical protein